MFGLLELFRGTHLAHHKWMNTEQDPAFETERSWRSRGRVLAQLWSLDVVQYFRYLFQSFRGRHPYVRPRRIALGAALSLAWIAFGTLIGRPDIVLKVLAISIYTTMIPVARWSITATEEIRHFPTSIGFLSRSLT